MPRNTHNTARTLRKINVFLFVATCFLGALYLYFMASITIAVAEDREIKRDIQEAQSRIAQLEDTYFTTVDAIDLATAQEMGFTLTDSYTFISLSENALALSS